MSSSSTLNPSGIHGSLSRVYLSAVSSTPVTADANNLLMGVQSVSIAIESGVQQGGSDGSGNPLVVSPEQSRYTISIEYTPVKGADAVQDLIVSGTNLSALIHVDGNETGNKSYSGCFTVGDGTLSRPFDSAASNSFTLSNNGTVAVATLA